MPDESVDCIVTSPPYWGLRDYGTATWEGGDSVCDHVQSRALKRDAPGGMPPAGKGTRGTLPSTVSSVMLYRDTCGKCGARRIDAQLGLEETPIAYVDAMVVLFRELRRVLTKRGTMWLNLGDSYVTRGGSPTTGSFDGGVGRGDRPANAPNRGKRQPRGEGRWGGGDNAAPGLKAKDLVGIPWRLAFALQDDGWYLRSDIIWAKPNPMPESVTDRPTKAHEYIFLMARSERYHYDAQAISEPVSEATHLRLSQNLARQIGSDRANGGTRADRPMKALESKFPSGWDAGHGHEKIGRYSPKDTDGRSARLGRGPGWRHNPKTVEHGLGIRNNESMIEAIVLPTSTRNARTVWAIPTQGYPDAHFATFPEELPRRCILAGCPEGGTVLDPFAGSGTTLAVARDLGRQAIGIELSPEYAKLIERRCAQHALAL